MHAGEVLAGRFRIEGLAGSGGMGKVFRAADLETGRAVAVKVLADRAEPAHAERFAREARVLADLRHPGIVGYVEHGVTGEGRPFLAMEWLDGEDLAARLARGRPSLADAVTLGVQVAAALAAAHGRGVVHRDVKPSNLFLVGGRADQVRLLDFGVARAAGVLRASTRTGTTLGTPGYMAPEQAAGQVDVDGRADLFSLGCVLFECVTGRPPFVAEHIMAVLARILVEEAPRAAELVPGLPIHLDRLLASLLAKDPAQRPTGAAEVARELAALAARDLDALTPVPVLRVPGLGRGEQRLIAVVLAGPAARGDALASTVVEAPPAAREQIERTVAPFGGTPVYLAGGAVMCTLAAPGAATDLAARAASCALAVHAVLPAAPVAVALGRAALTGRLPVGEAIDRAASLVAATPVEAGGIRLDEVTAGLLGPEYEVVGDDRGWALRGRRDAGGAVRTLLGRPTACVGRDRELASLESLIEECGDERRALAVLVTGPAGIGKSRLRYELVRRLGQHRRPVQVWVARGEPMSAGAPFSLISDALARECGLSLGQSREASRSRVEGRVARRVPAAEQLRVAAFIGELAGAPFEDDGSEPLLRRARGDPGVMAEQLRRAFVDLLAAECAEQPLLLVLEDLHWADGATVRLVDHALRALGDRPLMVLALARPELHDQFPRLWEQRRVEEIRLRELGRAAGERLVTEVLGDRATAEVAERLVRQSGGNAFYLEELIRAEHERPGDDTPATVLAMMQSRIEKLDSDARQVLRAASLFGGVFWRGGVELVLGDSAAARATAAWLDDLVDAEWIGRHAGSRFAGEDELAFRHDLVREAAYAMLTPGDRRVGHRLVADWLEQAGDSDRVLAVHRERAGDRERAVEHYLRAAGRALADGQPDVARAQLDRAASLQPRASVPGLRLLAAANRLLLRHRDTLEQVEQAMAGERSADERAVLAHLHIRALRFVDRPRLLELAAAALADADRVGDEVSAAAVLADAAYAAFATGSPERACAHADAAARRSWTTPRAQVEALRAQLFGAHAVGDMERAAALSREIGRHYLGLGEIASAANEGANLAEALLLAGRLEEADEAALAAMRLAREAGHSLLIERTVALRADALANLDRRDEALAIAQQSHSEAVAELCRVRAHLLLDRGRPREALEWVTIGLSVPGPAPEGIMLEALRARAWCRLGEHDEARARLEVAERRAGDTGDALALGHLAAAQLECLGGGDPRAGAGLAAARGAILTVAGHLAEPWRLCRIDLYRRVLEESGGIPAELAPPADSAG